MYYIFLYSDIDQILICIYIEFFICCELMHQFFLIEYWE